MARMIRSNVRPTVGMQLAPCGYIVSFIKSVS